MSDFRNQVYKTGLQASTDIHNGGTVFGIIFRQVLQFDNELRATLTNEIFSDKHVMDAWTVSFKKRIYQGTCTINEKHAYILFSNAVDELVIEFYFKETEPGILLCEYYTSYGKEPKHRESAVFVLDK
jgi:hypothetical protein